MAEVRADGRGRRGIGVDLRWPGTAAGLALALAAGVLAHLRVTDPARAGLLGLATLLALATVAAMLVAVAARDADALWEARRDAAVALVDARSAERHAELCSRAELRSRVLLRELQLATLDALRDPFLAHRLTRDPRHEWSLLGLLDEIDEHLGLPPAAD